MTALARTAAAASLNSMLRIRTLGGIAAETEAGEPIGAAVQGRRMALLVLVARAGSSGVSRDKLLAYLWAESDAERARSSLRQTLYALRRDLAADELILGTGDRLSLNPSVATVDADEFQRALAAGDLERAVGVYGGPFLDGFHLSGAPEFERWVQQERDELARQYRGALETLAGRATGARDHARAVELWRRIAAADPLDPRAALGLMRSLASAGNKSAALQHARVYEVLVKEELDTAPDPTVARFVEQLRAGAISPDEAPLPSGDRVVNPTPTPVAQDTGPGPERGSETEPGVAVTSPRERNSAQAAPEPTPVPPRRRRRVLLLAAVGAAGVAWFAAYRGLESSGWLGGDVADLSLDRVVVAPFNVLSNRPELRFWREGLVDVLSRNLDGAGPLRAIPPSYVIRQTRERSDRATALALGRGAGARFAVYGNIVAVGSDSVRVQTTLLDAESDRVLGEVDAREHESRIDRLADTLTLRFLRQIGELRSIGAARGHSSLLGARSLSALKLFLRGEQYFRRFELDRAQTLYEQAIALDSTFVLALRRAAARWWYGQGGDMTTLRFALHAGAMNRGLAPRDSLLVLADSINASLALDPTPETWLSRARRHLAVLEEVVRLYPDDPESWYQLAIARFQGDKVLGIPPEATLAAARECIDRDPDFAPAYILAAQMSLAVGSGTDARRYLGGYLARNPSDQALRLADLLLDPATVHAHATQRLLDTLPADTLRRAWNFMASWQVDSAESTLRVARRLWRLATSGRADSADAVRRLVRSLASRGRLVEARRLVGDSNLDLFSEFALFGVVPPDSADAFYRRALRDGGLIDAAIQWSWMRRDSAALVAALSVDSTGPFWMKHTLRAVRPYLSLAEHDTAWALREFNEVPDSLCPECWRARLTRARLLSARGDARQASAVLARTTLYIPDWAPSYTLALLEQARLAEQLRARPEAGLLYCRVARTWAHADAAVVASYAAEAERALRRLRVPCRPSP
ncbi:MAG: BTAD domain-containing putative transcriptional regulator [Gemmatimonadaceae bacterium]